MAKLINKHDWHLSPKEAIETQKQLAQEIKIVSLKSDYRYIVGLDCAFDLKKELCYAAAVLWDQQKKIVCDVQIAKKELNFPYIPGLLSFREAPAMLAAYSQLNTEPDLIIVDGQGIAHPRRLGIASHIGLWLEKPTIGCAKSKLVGEFKEPGPHRGDFTDLIFHQNKIGYVLRSKNNVRPLFVSPGHLIDHQSAVQIVLACCDKYRLPEPTRLADKLVGKAKHN